MKYVIEAKADIGRVEVEGSEHGVVLGLFDPKDGDPDPVELLLTAEEITDLSFAINNAKKQIRKDRP